jgi:hypothetical protein
MWMNHYRNSDVPRSDTIKNRESWIQEDIQQLTNTMNLLTSPSVKDRQQGMENLATLLPFLLLGSFTDLETLTYIKAKLEAAKLVREEMEHVEKAKEDVKKVDDRVVATENKIVGMYRADAEKAMQARELNIPRRVHNLEVHAFGPGGSKHPKHVPL